MRCRSDVVDVFEARLDHTNAILTAGVTLSAEAPNERSPGHPNRLI